MNNIKKKENFAPGDCVRKKSPSWMSLKKLFKQSNITFTRPIEIYYHKDLSIPNFLC